MGNLILGIVIGFVAGVVLAPIAIKLFTYLWNKFNSKVDDITKK